MNNGYTERVVYLFIYRQSYIKMCFIAVYTQSSKIIARGFQTNREALNYLYWAYEDNDLQPLGVYDSLFLQVYPYQHKNKPLVEVDLSLVEQVALEYISDASYSEADCQQS